MIPLNTIDCAAEPICFPGAVQPHGALLVLRAQLEIIEAASASCAALLGRSAESMLDRSLGEIVGPVTAAALLAGSYDGAHPPVHFMLNGKQWHARSSVNAANQVIIDIERLDGDAASIRDTSYKCRRDVAGLRRLGNLSAITAAAAALIRGMTGFDRVMIYRFDEAWNGEVIAESRADNVESYLGLSFPAGDIPRQARELFKSSKVRLIPDVDYAPSALIARRDGRAFDLGRSSLRSVSPLHIVYLQNMQVRATLVSALIVDGALWGLVACHHKHAPKYCGPEKRDALGWLCEDIAALIEATQIGHLREMEYSLATRRRNLVDLMRRSDLAALMQQNGDALLAVVDADGFALLAGDSIRTTGNTPQTNRIRELQKRRRDCETDPTLFASHHLHGDMGMEDAGDGIAGALFVSLRYRPDVTMIWFREKRDHAVRWAGDPEHAHSVDDDGRLSPRKSFAQFLQNIAGQSRKWTPEELESAAELGSLIEIETLNNSGIELEALVEHRTVELREATQTFRDIQFAMEGVGISILWADAETGRLIYVNKCAADVLGYTVDEMLRLSVADIDPNFDAANFQRVLEVVRLEGRAKLESVNRTRNGDLIPVELSIYYDAGNAATRPHTIAFVQDISKRKAADAALASLQASAEAARCAGVERLRVESEARMQSRKLEAVGTLAAGVAHDFNNILGSIAGYAEMAADDLPDGASAKANVEQILSASFRARDLIARMLAFARNSPVAPVAVEVVAQVREALALLRASLPSPVQLSFASSVDEAGAVINADPTQVTQIVMNLCVNAAHAMNDRGIISVRIERAAAVGNAPPAHVDGICLTVADGGSGMPPAVLDRMFDPFFTTKGPTEGSGLGLSVVHGVVADLGGVIQVQSQVGGANTGTEFRIFLPLVKTLSNIGEQRVAHIAD
jgi:PAS domain S-box-containing protein